MDYKYPPIYKYVILLILMTTFLKYYDQITKENYLVICAIFTFMIFIFDYVLIRNHPILFEDKNNNEINDDNHEDSRRQKIKFISIDDDDNEEHYSDLENDDNIELFDENNDNELTDEINRQLDNI